MGVVIPFRARQERPRVDRSSLGPTAQRFFAELDRACEGLGRRTDEDDCPPYGIPRPDGAR
jgi:hypothetical protein